MDVLRPAAVTSFPPAAGHGAGRTGGAGMLEGSLGPDQLAERLRAHRFRATAPRRLTYGALVGLGGHRSADEVYEEVLVQGGKLSRTSVYAALASLVAAGVAMSADAGPGRALYEAGGTWHHHVVCRGCGKVDDVACVGGERP